MKRWVNWLTAAGFGLALAACVPEFERALEGGEAADPALLGSWNAKSGGSDENMVIDVSAKDGGVAVVLRDPKGSEETLNFTGKTAELSGVRYISLTPDDPDKLGAGGVKVGYLIFRYAHEGETVKVWALDQQKIGKAIEEGRLKGTVTGSGTDTTPKITASNDEVAAFFATEEGQAAFAAEKPDDVLELTRVTP